MYEKLASNRFRKGQTVWVRSLQDILQTLDVDGKLDGLPFMPEMEKYCGRSFRISCLPTMTCIEGVGFRGLTDIVFLENLRCDGSSHDGCQRDCLLFWKEGWLSEQPVAQSSLRVTVATERGSPELKTKQGERYFCQSTELTDVASDYPPDEFLQQGKLGKLKKMLSEVRRGEMTVSAFTARIFNSGWYRLKKLLGMDTSKKVFGQRQKTKTLSLDLKPGEWVEVKTRKEIEETLDINGKNRGLLFDPPMLEYCGQRFQVEGQLQKMILEGTGQMISIRNTVLLKNNLCTAHGCPRANRPFWREIWLKRIEPPAE